jgi:hypothetical protein
VTRPGFHVDTIGLGDVMGDGLVDYVTTAGQGANAGVACLISRVPLQ